MSLWDKELIRPLTVFRNGTTKMQRVLKSASFWNISNVPTLLAEYNYFLANKITDYGNLRVIRALHSEVQLRSDPMWLCEQGKSKDIKTHVQRRCFQNVPSLKYFSLQLHCCQHKNLAASGALRDCDEP